MLSSCTKKYTDESGEKKFQFTFYCDRCESPHKIAPVLFGGNGSPTGEEGKKLWEMIWQKAHKQAFERVNFEAGYHFFCCPGCGEYVCRDCIISERTPSGELRDLCLDCNSRVRRKKNVPMRRIPHEKSRDRPRDRTGGSGLWGK